MKTPVFLSVLCASAFVWSGCGRQAESIPAQAEYTNSIQGELATQKGIADYAYAYGHAQGVMEEQKEKLQKLGSDLTIRAYSQADMEQQVEEIFWNTRTNSGGPISGDGLPPIK